jgi:hypothetical protein
MKLINYLILVGSLIGVAYADEATTKKMTALQQIESAFTPQSDYYTANLVATPWPAGLEVSIDNQWKLTLKSKNALTVSAVTIQVNDTAMVNKTNLVLQPGIVSHYFFSDVNTNKLLIPGYKFIGLYKQVSANDFIGFKDYRYRRIQVSLTMVDNNKNYTQSTTNFMLVMAK